MSKKLFRVMLTAEVLVMAEDEWEAECEAHREAGDQSDWEAMPFDLDSLMLPPGWTMQTLVYGCDEDTTVEAAIKLAKEHNQ